MDTLFHQTGLMAEAIRAGNDRALLSEECMGKLVLLPGLRDRLMLQAGHLMITMGEKLTAIGTKDIQLTQDPA